MCSVESCFADVESYPLMEMPPRAQHAHYIFAVAQAAVCTLLVEWEYDQPGDRYDPRVGAEPAVAALIDHARHEITDGQHRSPFSP